MHNNFITILLCSILITACSDPDETTGSNTISTSEIGLDISASVYNDNTSFVRVTISTEMREGTHRTDLKLGNGDQLLLDIDGTLSPLVETVWHGNPMFPENHYYYDLETEDNISLHNLSVEFVRAEAQNASSSITFGTPPDIISPSSGAVYSSSTDDVTVVIETDSSSDGDYVDLRQQSPCYRIEYFDELETVLVLPVVQPPCVADDVELQVTRHWRTEASSLLNQNLSRVRSRITRSVTVNYVP